MSEKLKYENVFESITDDRARADDLLSRSKALMDLIDAFAANSWGVGQVAERLGVGLEEATDVFCGRVSKLSLEKLTGYQAKIDSPSDLL